MSQKIFLLSLIPCLLALTSCEMPENKQEKQAEQRAAEQRGTQSDQLDEDFED